MALQLLFLGKHLGYLMERRLAGVGLNRTQALILTALSRHPGLKALDLCAPARVEPANVTRTLQSLERLDLLERRPHPTDGRASLVFLTAAGEALARDLSAKMESLSSELLEELSTEEQLVLQKALGRMWEAISRQLLAIGPQPSGMPGRQELPEEEPNDAPIARC